MPRSRGRAVWFKDASRRPRRLPSAILEPGGITLGSIPIDLSRIRVPAYFLSTREDHIAPWRATYRGTQLLAGKDRFVLAASGHIAGVVNPPEGGKYSHWISIELPATPED